MPPEEEEGPVKLGRCSCGSGGRLEEKGCEADSLQPRGSWHVRATSNLQVGDPSLLRGMPLARGLRGFASVLSARPPTAEYYELSTPVERIDTFISHNWTTPRFRKFLVLAYHFNSGLAVFLSVGVALGTCFLTAAGILPSVVGSWAWTENGEGYPRGVLCFPLGLATFLLALCCGHELDWISWGRCGHRHTLFLDKTCVHQTLEDRKREGIRCLAAFLARSDAFVMVYSDVYMQKLWTVYECASWLLLHPGRPIVVRPVLIPVLLASGVLLVAINEVYLTAEHAFGHREDIPPVVAYVTEHSVAPCLCAGAWLMGRLAADHEEIECRIAKFSLSDAKCASEDDRRVVQANIVAFMKLAGISGADEHDHEVFSAFEGLVRREVPRFMWSSNHRSGIPYGMPYLVAICPVLPNMFGSLDSLAGFYLEGWSTRHMVLYSVEVVYVAFLVWPITLALLAHLTRIRCLRSVPACLVIGIVVHLFQVGSFWVPWEIDAGANGSGSWLGLLLPFYGAYLLATVWLYYPRGWLRR